MEACFKHLKLKWTTLNQRRRRQCYGIVVDDLEDPLLNLRFADDALPIVQSRVDISRMMRHLHSEASMYGFSINWDKAKILTTNVHNDSRHVEIGGEHVDILDSKASERYLCLEDMHQVELSHRMSTAWGAFTKFKPALCSRKLLFALELKLPIAVVTPVALYGSASWTLTKNMRHESKR